MKQKLPASNPARRRWRIAGIVACSLVLLWLAVSYATNLYYKGYIRERLQKWVSTGTDSLYRISSGDVDINLISRELTITDIHLWPDSSKLNALRATGHAPLNTLDVHIPSISLRGLTWRKLRKGGLVRIRAVDIKKPAIRWEEQPRSTVEEAFFSHAHAASGENALKEISIDRLEIIDPELAYSSHNEESPWAFTSSGGDILVDNWKYTRGADRDTSRLFGADNIAATLQDVKWAQHRNPYRLNLRTLHVDTRQSVGEATGILLQRVGDTTPVREAYRLAVGRAWLGGMDFHHALHRRQVLASELVLQQPSITVSHTRGLPRKDTAVRRRKGHFPQQLLQSLPVPFAVPVINLSNADVSYVEYNPKTSKSAKLLFSNIEGRLLGASNLSDRPDSCTATLGGTFMERSPMYARFMFDLRDTNARFSIQARLQDLTGPQVSDAAQALALARIQKLNINVMNMDLKGSDTGTQATIVIAYDRLKLHLQQLDEETGTLYIRPVLSLLANKLMLYPRNPMPGEPIRIAQTRISRSKTESFFHLIWRNLFDATIQTAFRDEGMKAVLDHRKARKAQREERRRNKE